MKIWGGLMIAAIAGFSLTASAQGIVPKPSQHYKWQISTQGYLEYLVFNNGNRNDTIPFFKGKRTKGPAFYINNGEKDSVARWTPQGNEVYAASIGGVQCTLAYTQWKGMPALRVCLQNNAKTTFYPKKAGLKLGIDTYMDKYPAWFGKYFPTLMWNEKTHFYAYMQTPGGRTLGIVSPSPVASWSVDYNLGYPDGGHWFMGHRIESANVDLLNALPLPEHCPQNLYSLKPGERKHWIIAFVPIEKPDELEATMHTVARIPFVRMKQTTYCPGQTACFDVVADRPKVTVTDDRGQRLKVDLKRTENGVYAASCKLVRNGFYKILLEDGKYAAHALLTARRTYAWTLQQARRAALKYHQKATSHAESWYGFYSAFIAARYFPDAQLDAALSKRFDYLYDMLHDTVRVEPRFFASRIQNTSTTIGMLVDKYRAEHKTKDLKNASLLADWLMNTWQRQKDGAYVNHGTVYTSVIYVAKSMLELALAEYRAAANDAAWQACATRHYLSARRAIDQLVDSQGDFETEGELTFEDGMVSCSALQIGMLALMQNDEEQRRHYTEAMLNILNSHDCLAQLRVPDARRRGGTMRYWEAQYDVQMLPNMFNSPHGWSAWRGYATYYAYLLTGDEKWLLQTYNAMGAFANLIDYKTGDLRWAFVVDPYLKVRQTCSADPKYTADSLSFGNPHPDLYKTRSFVIGEQYVKMISDWQTVNTQDNDVHELFKCMGECMLTNAFVLQRPDGTVVGYNCNVKRNGGRIVVDAAEKQIANLHCNLNEAFDVAWGGQHKSLSAHYRGWAFGENEYLFKTK